MTTIPTPHSIGPVAAEVMRFDGDAEVIAVFERSFYVGAPGGMVCIGPEALGDGPLNVLLSGGAADWAQRGITSGAKGRVVRQRLRIGETFAVELTGVPVWTPPPWPRATVASVTAGLAAIRSLAPPLCPAEGLSALVIAGKASGSNLSAQAAAPTISGLATALRASLPGPTPDTALTRAATLLIGLGPGLTPSGDDLLGGVLLTLSALGKTPLREALWQTLEPELDMLTVDISGAHLAAAADGLGAASVHGALGAILAADTAALPGHLHTLSGIGHSSGFDTLAGIVLALEAAVAANVLPAV